MDFFRLFAIVLQVIGELQKLLVGQEVCVPGSYKGRPFQICVRFTPVATARTVKNLPG
jgi:hypothetical protein